MESLPKCTLINIPCETKLNNLLCNYNFYNADTQSTRDINETVHHIQLPFYYPPQAVFEPYRAVQAILEPYIALQAVFEPYRAL